MDSKLTEILDEWEEGMFMFPELLAEAYSTFLGQLVGATAAERSDPRVVPFLLAGYQAYLKDLKRPDPQAALTYRMALAMVGCGSNAPPRAVAPPPRPGTPPVQAATPRPATPRPATPRPATPLARSPSPQPGPSKPRSPSPQPGPSRSPEASKRPREEEDEDDVEEGPTLEILQTRERELKRFKTKFREEVVLIKGLGGALPSEDTMTAMFDSILQRQRKATQAKDDDRVIFEVENTEHSENPLWFSMRRADQLNGRVILDKLSRVLNSNQEFLAAGVMKLSYIHVPTPQAGGKRPRPVNESTDQWLNRKIDAASIWSPNNPNDAMCLTRSVAIATAKEGMTRQAFYKMKHRDSEPQLEAATNLCKLANIDKTKPCGIDEVRRLQDALPDYRLCVFTDKRGKECIFKGDYSAGKKNVYLLLHREHFSAILYPKTAFEYDYMCEKCVVFYNKKGTHRCDSVCWRCYGPNLHDDPSLLLQRCGDCGHQFAGDECYDTHKTLKLPGSDHTKCNIFKFCHKCETSFSLAQGRAHVCNFVYCSNCKHNVKENHLCYMTPWAEKEKKEKWKYITIYYDFECTQNDTLEGREDIFEHKPNLIVTQSVCDKCKHIQENDFFCVDCRTRQHIFHSLDNPDVNVVGQFLDYLQSFPAKTELLLVAHNAKAYDAVFVLREMIERKLKPEPILQGAKIICLSLGNWKFIDSLMFLPMPLSAMPKSFGLHELKKGYFPFLANKSEFYSFEGPLLAKEYYCVSGMKSKAASDFNDWYTEQTANNYVFNFRRELIEYCVSDVTILRQACQSFRSIFTDKAGFDPMFNCISLSSACMAAFRRNFLPPQKIGIVPSGGYHGRGRQSFIALQWLDYMAFKLGHKIKTIYTDREVKVLGRPVDGYVEVTHPDGRRERRIYQFHGDYWHQCPKHFPATEGDTENKFERTKRLTALFRREGFVVIEKWECEFREEMENDPEVKAFFQTHPTTRVTPLNLRDALAGGRTSAMRYYHKVDSEKGEKIKLVDVISEYPNANLRGEYPYGHPSIYLEGDPDMPPVEQWNGVIKATVLPPRDLIIPVLPYKCGGKLMFPLCRTCVEKESPDLCMHTDPKERALTGTWCAPEITYAIQEKSYTLLRTHEVYQYPGTMCYDPATGTDGLLSAYVRCFMALKIQASGWPIGCDTDEQRQEYISDVLKYDGIQIDPEKVEKNSALRILSKLVNNSFWGKFGERTLRSTTTFVYDYGELMKLVSDPKVEVQSLLPLGEKCLQVSYKPIMDCDKSLPTSSLLHAAFTTCHGRMHLYTYLDVVKDRALYTDTDSVCYISRPGELDLPLGTHLGDLTDQIEEDFGPMSYITEFCSGGPKNYGFKVCVGGDPKNVKVCVKVRGISITKSCDALVTFDNLKAMVLGEEEKMIVPIPQQIVRLPQWRIVTRRSSKTWQAKNTKRRRVNTELTVPHGFNAWGEEDMEDQEVLEALGTLYDA